jgi:hypothetical protein
MPPAGSRGDASAATAQSRVARCPVARRANRVVCAARQRTPWRMSRLRRTSRADAVTEVVCAHDREVGVLAARIDEHCEASGRSEGVPPTRRPCGARREAADAVADLASAQDPEEWTPWRRSCLRTTARSVCSHLPSSLPGAFAEMSSRTATCACSATGGPCSPASRACVHGLQRHRGEGLGHCARRHDLERPQHSIISPGDVVRASRHLIEHRVLAARIDEHCEASGRSEGTPPTRRPCGARREAADAVADVASARDREHGALAGRIDDDCGASGRSEGVPPTRRPCGARRKAADAVANVASARDPEHHDVASSWRPERRCSGTPRRERLTRRDRPRRLAR